MDAAGVNASSAAEETPSESAPETARRRWRPRAVLLGVLAFIALGWGLYGLSPWLLPLRIVEGPFAEQAGGESLTLAWYTSRGADCQLTLAGREGSVSAAAEGWRHSVKLTGLSPGTTYEYEISAEHRTLKSTRFQTNKPSGQPFTFIVFGDSGKGTPEQFRLAAEMTRAAPDFLLHTGDLIYSRGQRSRYRSRFFVPYGEMLERVCFWPSLGNHDVEHNGQFAYVDVFDLPRNGPAGLRAELNYWFDYASCRVAVVDSNLPETELAQHVAPWLRQVLSQSAARWKFVAMHHPPYTAGHYSPDTRIQKALVPAFEACGVDIVFTGHDHMYQRTLPMLGGQIADGGPGVVYVVSGAGGAGLYEALPGGRRPAYIASLNNELHSFTLVRIDGDVLHLRQIGLGESLLDEWQYTKPPADQ